MTLVAAGAGSVRETRARIAGSISGTVSTRVMFMRFRSLAEVGGLNPGVIQQSFGPVGRSNLSGLHDVPTVSKLECLSSVLLDQKDRHPAPVQLADHVEDLEDNHGGQSERRFVEEQ